MIIPCCIYYAAVGVAGGNEKTRERDRDRDQHTLYYNK